MHRPLPSFLLALGALVVAACGDNNPTQPKPAPHVDLPVSHLGTATFGVDTAGFPTISCQVGIHAASTGTAPAHWTGGVLRAYIGRDRATPVDTSLLSADDVAQILEGADLTIGATRDEEFIFSANIPFGIALEVHYTGPNGGATQRAAVQFTCGATPPPNTAPPAVTVHYVDPGVPIEPGSGIDIDFTATSDFGLWRTTVGLSGPCTVTQSVNESMLRSVSRRVHFVLPSTCQLGVPIQVSAAAMDAAMQQTTVSQPTPLMLVDRTPPTLDVMMFPPGGGSAMPLTPMEYFDGDSLQIYPIAGDNSGVRALVWEIPEAGIRDSVLAPIPWTLKIPVRSAWGKFGIRFFARDGVGLESPVVATAAGFFTTYPTIHPPAQSATVPYGVDDMLVDMPGDRIFLLERNAHAVVVLRASTMQVARTINLTGVPTAFDQLPGSDTLWIATMQSLSSVDLADASSSPVTHALASLASGEGVWAFVLLPDGRALLNTNGPGTWGMREVDRASWTERVRTDQTAQQFAAHSMDHRRLFARSTGCVQRYDVATDAWGACGQATIPYDGAATADLTGERYVNNLDVADGALQRVRALRFPNEQGASGGVYSNAISPDGGTLYFLLWWHYAYRERVSDGTFIDRVDLPGTGATIIRLSADGKTLVSVSGPWNGPTTISRITLP